MKNSLFVFLCILFISCSNDDGDTAFDGSEASLEDLFSEEVVQALNDLNFTIVRKRCSFRKA